MTVVMTDEQSIRAGGKALDRWIGGYPWYDPRTDDLRRIDVSESWLEKFFRWLHSNLNISWPANLFDWLYWLAVAALFALLAYLSYRFWKAAERGRQTGEEGGKRDEEDAEAAQARRTEAQLAPVARSRSDLLAEARRNYNEGRYNEAIIYLFSHELVELDKHRLVRMMKGKTNREYLAELGARLALRRLLEQTMVAFEDVFFGNYAIDRTRFESCWLRLDEFEALAAEGAA
jgi:hypothetical protein